MQEETTMKRFTKWYPVLAMVAIDVAFAVSNILLTKVVSDGIDHLVFITYRQSVSAIFLLPLAYFLERGSRPKLTFSILCSLFISAAIGVSVTQYLFLLGIEYTSAMFSCAFLNLVPVLTFILALPFGLESVSIRCSSGRGKVAGATVCVGGAILLTIYKGRPLFRFPASTQSMSEVHRKMDSSRWVIGSVALFAGTICYSSWFLLQSNIGRRYPCQYSSTAVMAFFSAVQAAVFSFSIDRELSVWILRNKVDILIVFYAGMIGSGLCFVGMSWCVKKRGSVFTAAFSPLVQIMAAIYDVPFMHEQLHLGSVIGSVIVICGLYVMLWGKDREMRQNQEKLVEEMVKKDQEIEFQVVKISVELESQHP